MAIIRRWAAAFGYRNILYLALVAALVLLSLPFPANNPSNFSRAAWYFALMNWAAVSLVFFFVNTVLVVIALVKGQSPVIPLIACVLPVLCVVVPGIIFG